MEDLRRERATMTDVNIICSDGSVPSHKLFLASLSNHLRDHLRSTDEDSCVIMMPDISVDIMTAFLKSVYDGRLPQDGVTLDAVRDVFRLLGCDNNIGFDYSEILPDEDIRDPNSPNFKPDNIGFYSSETVKDESEIPVRIRITTSSKLSNLERLERTTTNLETSCALCSDPVHAHRVSVAVKQEKNSLHYRKLLYVCCTCGHVANTPSKFLAHNKIERLRCGESLPHKFWQFNCILCQEQMNKHQTAIDSSFNCCHCEESFSTGRMLTHHHVTVKNSSISSSKSQAEIQSKIFEACEDCSQYKSKKAKMVHYKESHPDHYMRVLKKNLETWMTAPSSRYIECDLCNLSMRKSNLKGHKLNKHCVDLDNKPVSIQNLADRTCDICGHVSAYANDVKKHKKFVHDKILNFSCKFCNKRFSNKGNLNQHEVSHTGVTPYQCHQCGNGFRRRAQLTKHLESHEKGTCLIQEPEPPVPPSGQPGHQMPLVMTHLDSGTLRHTAPGMFKDLAVTQAPALKMPAFIIH